MILQDNDDDFESSKLKNLNFRVEGTSMIARPSNGNLTVLIDKRNLMVAESDSYDLAWHRSYRHRTRTATGSSISGVVNLQVSDVVTCHPEVNNSGLLWPINEEYPSSEVRSDIIVLQDP